MRTRIVRAVGVVAMLGGAGGCGSILGPRVCTDEARPALHVAVRDSVTNARPADGARVIARDGTYADTVHTSGEFDPGLAHERPGTYTVSVEAAGYLPWSRTGIRVRDDGCHVRTVSLTARLQR